MATKWMKVLLLVAMTTMLATGCGRTPTEVPLDDPSYTDPANSGTNNNNSNFNNGGTTTPIYNPGTNVQPAVPVQINATVTEKKMKRNWATLFFTKKIDSVTIQLQNPGSTAATGKVTITFSKGGAQTETQEQPFSLAGGQTTTIQVTPTKTSDDAVATTTTDQGSTGGIGGGTTGGTTGGSTGWPSSGTGF